ALFGPIGLQLQDDLLKCEHAPILRGKTITAPTPNVREQLPKQ
ncbi:MAG: hypothetical protein RIR09_905, partial [Pseudomonadota bacterium]